MSEKSLESPAPAPATAPALYRRLRHLLTHKYAPSVLGAASFAESIISPLPPDALLAPMAVTNPHRAYSLAFLTCVFSVLGGIVSYMIGAFFMDYFGWALVDFYQMRDVVERSSQLWRDYGVFVVLIGSFSPIPYKIIALMSGVFVLDPLIFVVFSFIGRGGRFFLVAFLCKTWGFRAEQFLLRQIMRSGLRSAMSLFFLASFMILSVVWFFELVLGIAPCPICEWQRWPYYGALLLGATSLFAMREVVYFWALLFSTALFAVSGTIGAYHAGIEWGFWQGPDLCSGGEAIVQTIGELKQALQASSIPSCSEAGFRLFGISLAGYNVIISSVLVLLGLEKIWDNKKLMS